MAFDFGYMKRPVIYYQYDEEEYFKGHYIKGYFDYRRNGFGPVLVGFNDVLKQIRIVINNKFEIEEKYLKNQKLFFPLWDNKNSERIYNHLIKK